MVHEQRIALRIMTLAFVAFTATACGPATDLPSPAAGSGEWREFEGSWSAAGTRHTLSLGADRRSAVFDLRGSMLLSGPGRPIVGFRSEVIALSDSASGLTGRSVWTDEAGDQVFSEIKGQGTAARNRIEGTIFGGTGRYAGVTGTYEFSWKYVIESEEGTIQGRAVGLKGRVRRGAGVPGGAR